MSGFFYTLNQKVGADGTVIQNKYRGLSPGSDFSDF